MRHSLAVHKQMDLGSMKSNRNPGQFVGRLTVQNNGEHFF